MIVFWLVLMITDELIKRANIKDSDCQVVGALLTMRLFYGRRFYLFAGVKYNQQYCVALR